MIENHTTLATFYKGWEVYQELLTKAIAPLSPDQLALLAAPYLRSIGVLAAHIISARGRENTVSRQWIIWHIIEHDLHHGGELSYTLGIHGLAAPDL